MDDVFECWVCAGSLFGLLGLFWIRSIAASANETSKKALAVAMDDAPVIARQLYDVIRQLEARIAVLEKKLARYESGETPTERAAPSDPSTFRRPEDARTAPASPPLDETQLGFAAATESVTASVDAPLPTETAATASGPVETPMPEPSASPAAPRPAFETPPTQPVFLPQVPPPASESSPASAPAKPVPTPPTKSDVSLEQWLGVRGAAAAGAIVLAIAAVYFFRYSIEHGLISPATRVVLGTLTGLACIGASELRLRHTHRTLGEYLAGAGFAILYLAFWAAGARYHLVPNAGTTVLLVVTTLASCALAYVRSAVPVATLGLLGGFATPILLSTGEDRPIALFSYLLMLDVALLVLARKRTWVWLAVAAVFLTFTYQLGWVITRLDPPRMLLGVAIVLVFSAVFAIAFSRGEAAERFRGPRLAALLLPSLFAFYFGASPTLGQHFGPTLAMLLVVSAGAAFVGRDPKQDFLRTAVGAASVVTAFLHFVPRGSIAASPWLATATFVGLLAIQAVADEVLRRRPVDGLAPARTFDLVLGVGLFTELVTTTTDARYDYPSRFVSVASMLGLATFASVREAAYLRMIFVSFGVTSLVALHHATRSTSPGFPPESLYLGFVVAAAASLQIAPVVGRLLRRDAPEDATRRAEHGAGLAAALALFALAFVPPSAPIRALPYAASACLLLVLSSLVATRRRHGGWLVATMAAATIANVVQQGRVDALADQHVPTLAGLGAFALLAAALPLFVGRHAAAHVGVYRAAALAAPSVLLPALFAFRRAFGQETSGLVPLALAGYGLGSLVCVRLLLPVGHATRVPALAWTAGAALSMVSIAIPVQLENEWITVGWALQGAAIVALYRRLDHAGIKYYAAALFAFATLRLVLNDEVLRYHPPSGMPILNWIAYTYLVPVACLVFAGSVMNRIEVERYRPSERAAFPKDRPVLGALYGLAAIVVGFVFLNLTVIDAFAEGRALELPVQRLPARDLVISLAWALYAVTLLALGMWKKSTALRSLSLGLVLLTCLKVFLYDLGNLKDLYRVASLLGLSVALIGISLAYKRFVFRDTPESSE